MLKFVKGALRIENHVKVGTLKSVSEGAGIFSERNI